MLEFCREVFGFAAYQENAENASRNTLTMERSDENAIKNRRVALRVGNAEIVSTGNFRFVPQYRPNVKQQVKLSGHILS